ncbi:MAG TPA: chemotaxis response regulator protein-glutamate methylesterase [Bryobacteraceae bacterium]|nr:chemotaxis response regulator protein-glutamate methylesterase [Bryobacteraceae bacterium]
MRAGISRKMVPLGGRIRVLVVDDSVVIRRLVTHAISEDPSMEVVGVAANGAIALERIAQLNPDAITLDIEMPGMDGLTLLRRLKDHAARPRVVMFSTLTDRGAALTLESLALGADDYVTKAANAGSLDRSMASLRAELIPKIRQFFLLAGERPAVRSLAAPAWRAAPGPAAGRGTNPPRVIAIGVSTGGPTALGAIMPQFPDDFPLPILIVQHMPALFTRFLAERLQAVTRLQVAEAGQGSRVVPGTVWIAPGDYHMRVRRNGDEPVIQLDQSPPENSCRPSVDVLFRSVGEVYGGAAVAAVLTGMGQDGLRGAEALRARGAMVIAQDEASSVVWGMPGAVAQAGLAHCVLPLDAVVPEIVSQTAARAIA